MEENEISNTHGRQCEQGKDSGRNTQSSEREVAPKVEWGCVVRNRSTKSENDEGENADNTYA